MLPRKGVLSNLIGFLVLVLLISGLANGQTAKPTTDEKPVPTTKQTQADSNVISEPAVNAETKPIQSPEEVASTTAEDKTKIDPPAAELAPAAKPQATPVPACRQITANVVAMPQPIMLNRLGAVIPD
ncbi:MAG TPA: hypothetical protein VF435_12905, partial [Pyrinomonadaceae bacterium]